MWQQFLYASLIPKYFPFNSKRRPEKLYPNIIYFGLELRYQMTMGVGYFPIAEKGVTSFEGHHSN